jgi:hypothetical protein
MYDEREQDGFGIGDALASLALILGGGAAGRKMAGKTAIPTKKELEALMQAMKASGNRAMNTPPSTYAAAAKQKASNLYNRAFVNPQQTLDLPAATIGDYLNAAKRAGQRGMQNARGTMHQVMQTPVRNPLVSKPTQLSFDFDNPL